jgi:glutamate synthase (ferredoxin)
MSLEMRLGARGNLLQPGEKAYTQVLLKSPILLESQLEAIQVCACLRSLLGRRRRVGLSLGCRLAP